MPLLEVASDPMGSERVAEDDQSSPALASSKTIRAERRAGVFRALDLEATADC